MSSEITEMRESLLIYEQLLKSLTPALTSHGFRRRSQRFHLCHDGNWSVVEFQKSTRSTGDKVIFTVNLGVALRRLLTFAGLDATRPAPIEECHWRERLGFLVGSQDKWWTIDPGTAMNDIGQELQRDLLNFAVPEVTRFLDEQALKALWLQGQSPGLTDIQRLKHLSVLLKALGPPEELERTLRDLKDSSKGKPTAGMVAHHIARLNAIMAP